MSQTATVTKIDNFHLSDAGKWDSYLKYRHQYPDSMFRRWLQHHGADEPLEHVHDLGSGAGVGASAFLNALPRIIGRNPIKTLHVSDPGANNINAARRNLLGHDLPDTKVVFHHGPGEQPNPNIRPGSLDFVMACECLHWTDIEPTMKNIAASLRPGGTFAAVLYSAIPTITSNERAQQAQKDLEVMWHKGAGPCGFIMDLGKRLQSASGLDFVPMDSGVWEEGSVVRWYCNIRNRQWPLEEMTWGMQPDDIVKYWPPHKPNFAKTGGIKGEEVTTDLVDWGLQGLDVQGLKNIYAARFPGVFDDAIFDTEEWRNLVAEVQAGGGTVDCEYPAVMILAKKK